MRELDPAAGLHRRDDERPVGLADDPRDQLTQCCARPPAETPPREGQIVGVARVDQAEARGHAGEPAVQRERGEVGQRGRGRGALGEMGRGEPPLEHVPGPHQARPWRRVHRGQHGDRCAVGGQARERPRDRGRVTDGREHAEHPRGRNRGEEVAQVEPEHHARAGVQRRVAVDRAAPHEAVGRGVGRDRVEDLVQRPALDLLQARLGRLDQPLQAAAARRPPVAVVTQPLGRGGPLQSAGVGEPRELPIGELQPFGELVDGRQGRDRPVVAQRRARRRGRVAESPGSVRCRSVEDLRVSDQEGVDRIGQRRPQTGILGRGSVARGAGHDRERETVQPGRPEAEHCRGSLGGVDLVAAAGQERVGDHRRERLSLSTSRHLLIIAAPRPTVLCAARRQVPPSGCTDRRAMYSRD